MAGGGQAGDEAGRGVTVATDGLVVVVVSDVKGVLAVARDGGGADPVELTAVKASIHRGVLQIDSSDAAVVVVHGNVEHATAHLHGNRIAVGDVAVGIRRVGRPCAGTVAMRDRIVRTIALSDDYWHGGGMSSSGDILAIPLEFSEDRKSRVYFLHMGNPRHPKRIPVTILRKGFAYFVFMMGVFIIVKELI